MTIAFPKPDEGVIARRDEILTGLARLVAPEALVTSEDERRAFETDALTAYRKMPLAVVLPSTTEEVSAVLKFCHEHGIKVVARGAGTSLCGGAIPQEDAIILGVAKMNSVLEPDFANRTVRVQAGVTNLAISQEVAPEGFFYAPDPSSQLACTIAGNIAMNSGGAHCLKYGVTTLPPIIFPGRPERWWGDEALKAETDAPQATLEQRHQAAGDVLAVRCRGFFSGGALFKGPPHSRGEPPKKTPSERPRKSRSRPVEP